MASEEEVAALRAELAELKRGLVAQQLRDEIAAHKAEPAREWHRVVFVTKGRRKPGALIGQDGPGWDAQSECGSGYYVVEDGVVLGVVDDQGKPLPHGEPSHEHEVRQVLTTCPYEAP